MEKNAIPIIGIFGVWKSDRQSTVNNTISLENDGSYVNILKIL